MSLTHYAIAVAFNLADLSGRARGLLFVVECFRCERVEDAVTFLLHFGKLRASIITSRVDAFVSTTGSATLSCASTGGDFDVPFERRPDVSKLRGHRFVTHQQQGSAGQDQSITWATRPLRSMGLLRLASSQAELAQYTSDNQADTHTGPRGISRVVRAPASRQRRGYLVQLHPASNRT